MAQSGATQQGQDQPCCCRKRRCKAPPESVVSHYCQPWLSSGPTHLGTAMQHQQAVSLLLASAVRFSDGRAELGGGGAKRGWD